MRRTATLAALTIALAACAEDPVAPVAGDPRADTTAVDIPDRYIVVLRAGTAFDPGSLARLTADSLGGTVHFTYRSALRGVAATLSPEALAGLKRHPHVAYVEPDRMMHASRMPPTTLWGLDRTDQRSLPLDAAFTAGSTGAGVRVYIIDSGIRPTHTQFGGRASIGFDALGGSGDDCNGHGTHVAGTVGGSTYGVAKSVTLIGVRTLDCAGSGPTSSVIAAVDWVTANAVLPAVANMSLGGGTSDALDAAVEASIAAGVTYVVSAGNDADDACLGSPARVPAALTVGATTIDDVRSYFSNWGPCLDIFAPGSGILSAWYTGNSAAATASGTSMASPHVAGVAALVLAATPAAPPAAVAAAILDAGSFDRLAEVPPGTTNLMLYSGLTVEAGPRIGLSATTLALAKFVAPPPFTAPGFAAASAPAATVTITNTGTGTLDWQVADNTRWMTASPASGSLAAGASEDVTLTLSTSDLAPGPHAGWLRFTSTAALNATMYVNVRLDMTPVHSLPLGTPADAWGVLNSLTYYRFEVPPHAASLQVTLAGGSGDADLFLRAGVAPTAGDWTCRPWLAGNDEECVIANPAAGTWWVLLHGFDGYSGAGLTATVDVYVRPTMPVGLAATAASSSALDITWTDTADETYYRLQWEMRNPDGTYGANTYITPNPAADATGYTHTGLLPNQRYRYRLRACSPAGCSDWSAFAKGWTLP